MGEDVPHEGEAWVVEDDGGGDSASLGSGVLGVVVGDLDVSDQVFVSVSCE